MQIERMVCSLCKGQRSVYVHKRKLANHAHVKASYKGQKGSKKAGNSDLLARSCSIKRVQNLRIRLSGDECWSQRKERRGAASEQDETAYTGKYSGLGDLTDASTFTDGEESKMGGRRKKEKRDDGEPERTGIRPVRSTGPR